MSTFVAYINFVYSFMNIEIYLLGYSITLFQLFMYGLIGSIVLFIFFRLTR